VAERYCRSDTPRSRMYREYVHLWQRPERYPTDPTAGETPEQDVQRVHMAGRYCCVLERQTIAGCTESTHGREILLERHHSRMYREYTWQGDTGYCWRERHHIAHSPERLDFRVMGLHIVALPPDFPTIRKNAVK
jgi:hypothetical protein